MSVDQYNSYTHSNFAIYLLVTLAALYVQEYVNMHNHKSFQTLVYLLFFSRFGFCRGSQSQTVGRIAMPTATPKGQQTPWSTMLHPTFQSLQSATQKPNLYTSNSVLGNINNSRMGNFSNSVKGNSGTNNDEYIQVLHPNGLSTRSVSSPSSQSCNSFSQPRDSASHRLIQPDYDFGASLQSGSYSLSMLQPNIFSQGAKREQLKTANSDPVPFSPKNGPLLTSSPALHRSNEMVRQRRTC